MKQQEEDVRIEDEISKQMGDITTKTLKKTKDMDTFERKAQEIRLTKPLSHTTLGMGKKFKRRKSKHDQYIAYFLGFVFAFIQMIVSNLLISLL